MFFPLFSQIVTQTASIMLGVIGISFLVAIHELGHFLCCKLFNVRTPSFSIGFGPRLYTKKIGETEFSFSALPLGGYVEIAGIEEVGQGTQEHAHATDSRSFTHKTYLQKIVILLAGIVVNIGFAYGALALLFHFSGIPSHPLFISHTANNVIETVAPETPAAQAGLQAGDRLIGIDAMTYAPAHMPELLAYLRGHADQDVMVHITRDSKTLDIPLHLAPAASSSQLGVSFSLKMVPALSWLDAIQASGSTIVSWIGSTFGSLKTMCSQRTTRGLGGPIAVIHGITASAAKGLAPFLIILCFVSVGIACLNLLPLPIFDGGQVLFYTLEAISGRSLNEVRIWIHYISWSAVLLLMVFLSWRDIARIIWGS